ncbi:MAG: hypothetical protein GYB31_07880 [Bacteroidetes bacterium]|nr:hypothetical protein [Bacteroidota bacterium]
MESTNPSFRARHRLTGHNASIYALSPGETPREFYSAAGDGWIVHWDLNDPELGRLVAEAPEQIFSLCYLPGKNEIVAGTMNGLLNWVDLDDPDNTKRIDFHKNGIFDIRFFENTLYTLGGDGLLTAWDPESKRPLESLKLSGERLRCIDYSKERNELAVGASDGNIYLLDQASLNLRDTIGKAHELSAFTLVYTPNGKGLVSGGRDAMLKKWSLENSIKNTHEIPAHQYTINMLAIDPGGRMLATGSRDRNIRIWDLEAMTLLKQLEAGRDKGHINSVNRLLWTSYQDLLISASDDQTMIVWER